MLTKIQTNPLFTIVHDVKVVSMSNAGLRGKAWHILLLAILVGSVGCGPAPETARKETETPLTKEALFQAGHRLYLQQQYDSAQVLLTRVLTLDRTYAAAVADLASLNYELAMRADAGRRRNELLRASRAYYLRLDSLNSVDADAYERLCEIASALNDHRTFLTYAKKSAEAYPYDRQYYNLSVAYFNVNDFASVIKVCKEAIEKFPASPFIGTFYRQLGRGYMKVDRDQTAERTFYAGLGVIEKRMADARKSNADYVSSADYQRLKEDMKGILISLKNLHTTYKATEKLAEVEKKLKELGR